MCRKLRGHASVKREAQAEGAVRQAFRGGLRQELADFYRLLATLEGQADTPLPDRSQPEGPTPAYLSLRRLLVWLGDPLVWHPRSHNTQGSQFSTIMTNQP